MAGGQCDTCAYLAYDEETDQYVCTMDVMDEDELERLISSPRATCPYYRDGDEYKMVRKQN